MLKRSLLKLQPSLAANFKPYTSRLCFALSLLLSAVFIMPSAQAAKCKLPKSYYKNVSCTSSSGYFLAIKDFGAPVALLNSSGKKVADLSRYEKVAGDKIAGGLIPVQRSGRVGYVNMQGREVIPTVYDVLDDSSGWARPVSEGRIVVKKDGNYGVIDTANKTIVAFSASISSIDNYRSGIAQVRKNQSVSQLDKNGKVVSNSNNSDLNNSDSNRSNGSAAAANNIKNSQSKSLSSNTNGFTTLQPSQQDGKWGFVDDENVTMITYSFDEVRPFSEGLAGVRVDNNWGFLNLGGELVIPFRFDNSGVIASERYKGESAFVFKSGKAWIGNLQNGNKMCIDKNGTSVGCD